MIGRRVLFAGLVCLSFILIGAGRAAATECDGQSSVLGSFEGSKDVGIFRVISVEAPPDSEESANESAPATAAEGNTEEDPKPQAVMLEVMRVYKGGLKTRQMLKFVQYSQAEDGWSFDPTDVGKDFLLYLGADSYSEGTWGVENCGRSRHVEEATDDLLYLNNMSKLIGRTRVSGTISWVSDAGTGIDGITIHFQGAKGNFNVKTDAHGVYEIYDMPAGKYLVSADLPKGWKIDGDSWYQTGPDANADPLPTYQVQVVPHKHAALDMYFKIDNAVRGKIYFPQGGSLAGEWVRAMSTNEKDTDNYYAAQIGEDGTFDLTGLPSGAYFVVINDGGVVSASMPFPAFYYPGVTDKTLATQIYIGPGMTLDGINISAPMPAETITINGRFLFADGKPVADQSVTFTSDNTDPLIYGDAYASTDAEGKFSLRILKGQTGNIVGNFGAYTGQYLDAAELDAAIRAAAQPEQTEAQWPGQTPETPADPSAAAQPQEPETVYASIPTDALTVTADKDIDELVLPLPFHSYQKAPDPPAAAQ